MKKIFNIFNIYVFLLVLYEALALLGATSSLTYLSLGTAIVIALFYIVRAVRTADTQYMRALLIVVLLLIVYGIIRFTGGETLYAGNESRPQSFLLLCMHQLPSILVFYILAREGKIKVSEIKIWFFVFLIVAYLRYQHNYNVYLEWIATKNIVSEEMTNNMGYLFLSLIPLLAFFNKKPWVQYVCLGIIGFFVINSAKRGAILLFVISIVFFLLLSYKNSNKTSRRGIVVFLFSLVFLIIGVRYVQNHFLSSDYFATRWMETMEGDSNGRDQIYSIIWHHYFNDYNAFQLFFGGGAESTLRYFHFYAHNDWLQLLSDCGLLGIAVYLFYWVSYYRTIRKYKHFGKNDELYILLITAFIIAFGRTLFSMSYTDIPASLGLAIGYGMGMADKKIKANASLN